MQGAWIFLSPSLFGKLVNIWISQNHYYCSFYQCMLHDSSRSCWKEMQGLAVAGNTMLCSQPCIMVVLEGTLQSLKVLAPVLGCIRKDTQSVVGWCSPVLHWAF